MELRQAGLGFASPPTGHEGMGYWRSPYLIFGMSVVPTPEQEHRAKILGEQLEGLFRPDRTGTNAFTFLLAQHTPSETADVVRVRSTFSPAHYARLVALKQKFDPANLMGSDRNIPPM